MGRALFNACLSSCSDDSILLAKAAQIMRKDLLRHEQQFNDDISRERQFEGIPSSIFQLTSLIIEGGYTQDSTPECSEKIIGNLSQLIMFNTVKNKRKETVSHVRHSKFRNSCQRCSVRKGVLGNFANFTGKHQCQSLFFNKVALKKRLWHRCFPVNFAKCLSTPFFKEHLRWLLLEIHWRREEKTRFWGFHFFVANLVTVHLFVLMF